MSSRATLYRVVALCVASMGVYAVGLAQQPTLRLVAHDRLNGEGLNGDLTIVGTTAVVAAGMMAAGGVHADRKSVV